MKKIIVIVVTMILALTLCACGSVVETIDYGSAEAFERALNNGEDGVGKIVSFKADSLNPNSLLGYDIWAGEHLNFLSAENPNIKVGETVVVRITEVNSFLGSWNIYYEKISAEVGENTIY